MIIVCILANAYFHSVDQCSLAEECGLKPGDQILEANGNSFASISHKDAVEYIRNHKHIIMTVKVSPPIFDVDVGFRGKLTSVDFFLIYTGELFLSTTAIAVALCAPAFTFKWCEGLVLFAHFN